MTANDILRSIRYMLDLSDIKLGKIAQLADPTLNFDSESLKAMQKHETDPGYLQCSDSFLIDFLDGLVIYRRGRREDAAAVIKDLRATNNVVLKKLRVAFELKDVDLQQVLEAAGFLMNKAEISALFRQPEHRNFRACGDQVLRNFLKGLTIVLAARGARSLTAES